MQRLRPSFNAVWQGIGAQLRNPSGLWGQMAGSMMAFVNAKPNTLALSALSMRDGESLLELGCFVYPVSRG